MPAWVDYLMHHTFGGSFGPFFFGPFLAIFVCCLCAVCGVGALRAFKEREELITRFGLQERFGSRFGANLDNRMDMRETILGAEQQPLPSSPYVASPTFSTSMNAD